MVAINQHLGPTHVAKQVESGAVSSRSLEGLHNVRVQSMDWIKMLGTGRPKRSTGCFATGFLPEASLPPGGEYHPSEPGVSGL